MGDRPNAPARRRHTLTSSCAMCGAMVCKHDTLAGVELVGDPATRVVRFTVYLRNGGTMCGALPATECAALARDLERASREAHP